MVQWLRLCVPNQGAWVRSHMWQLKKKGSHVPQLKHSIAKIKNKYFKRYIYSRLSYTLRLIY